MDFVHPSGLNALRKVYSDGLPVLYQFSDRLKVFPVLQQRMKADETTDISLLKSLDSHCTKGRGHEFLAMIVGHRASIAVGGLEIIQSFALVLEGSAQEWEQHDAISVLVHKTASLVSFYFIEPHIFLPKIQILILSRDCVEIVIPMRCKPYHFNAFSKVVSIYSISLLVYLWSTMIDIS